MTDVLFVSKPVAPPWNDSSKNLVRDVAMHLRRHGAVVMGSESDLRLGDAAVAMVYASKPTGAFSPRLRDHLAVLRYLAWRAKAPIWHFFFAPNRRSSTAGRWTSRIRAKTTVHTLCSLPPTNVSMKALLFADITVALSKFSEARLVDAGISADRIRRVPPCVPALPVPMASKRGELRARHGLPDSAPICTYPGDLEHGDGAQLALDAFACVPRTDALLLMACRNKTASAERYRRAAHDRAKQLGLADRVRWLGETRHIHEILALSDCIVLPSRSSFAKMDYPLVALEAMSMEIPVLFSEGTPATELADRGVAVSAEPRADALGTAIQTLLDDDGRRRDLGRVARTFVTDELSPERTAEAYERIYEELHG
jgi:phosphatidylinositol alpha-1,6-mannosyltransferase